MLDKRVEALKLATAKKKQEALKRTEQAIQTLLEKNYKITIRSVAREAGVSASYIYKYPELSYRIQTLREQQKYNPIKPEAPSSKSHRTVATLLHNKIKLVEQEKEELIRETEALAANVDEMIKSESSLKRLKAENIKLLAENQELKRQLEYLEKKTIEQRNFILKQGYKDRYDEAIKNSKLIQLVPDHDNL